MERDDALVQRVFEQEDIVDRSEKEITEYLIKINRESIREAEPYGRRCTHDQRYRADQ
ncbi:MAG: hypothetical protein ACLTXL_01950 [Clostridia bacterium]